VDLNEILTAVTGAVPTETGDAARTAHA